MAQERPYGPGGNETQRGTKHFAAGAKVYVRGTVGSGADRQVEVIGHHRGSLRYATMIVRPSWLTHWRVQLVYSPHVIDTLWPSWDGTPWAKDRAEQLMRLLTSTIGRDGLPDSRLPD
jgi:hypothetical protein